MNEEQRLMLERVCNLAKEYYALDDMKLVKESGLPIKFFITGPMLDDKGPVVHVVNGLPKLADLTGVAVTDAEKGFCGEPQIEMVYDGVAFRQAGKMVGEYQYD